MAGHACFVLALVPPHGSSGFLSTSSSLARSSAQVSRSHLSLDSRLSQRGFLIKPTVNPKNQGTQALLGGAAVRLVLFCAVHLFRIQFSVNLEFPSRT